MQQTLPTTPNPSTAALGPPTVPADLVGALRACLSPHSAIEESLFARRLYSRDLAEVSAAVQALLLDSTPRLVVRPAHAGDVAAVLRLAHERRVPVVPRGVGSGGVGGAVPVHGGIVLDLSPFSRVLAVDPAMLTVTLEPGARPGEVNQKLEAHGLELCTYQTSLYSTLGGWIAGGGYGMGGFAGGHVSRHVVELDLVTPAQGLQTLRPGESGFLECFGSEGQYGILTRLVLRVRTRPTHQAVHLWTFDGPKDAWDFVAELCRGGIRPAHLKYLDRGHVAELNHFEAVERGRPDLRILDECDSVLMHFDRQEDEARFLALDPARFRASVARQHQAWWMWNDRFTPLKLKKHGPSLLGAEVVLRADAVARWIELGRAHAQRMGVQAGFEASVNAVEATMAGGEPVAPDFVVVAMASWTCDRRERTRYLLGMGLSALLTTEAIALGGRPYGLGIWNSPFLPWRFTQPELARRLTHKSACDPAGILNAGKFPSLRSRWLGLPGLALRPRPFALVMRALRAMLPVAGWLARRSLFRLRPEAAELEPVLQSLIECSACGACMHVCPAYQVTRDERVTGRAKLQLAGWLAEGRTIQPEDVSAAFACLHCGLCERVCQSQLPLVDRWDRLEDLLGRVFGRPDAAIQDFARRVDADRSFLERVPLGLNPRQHAQTQAELLAAVHKLQQPPATPPPATRFPA